MIPVLITAVLNRPDLLDRMLMSVDIRVGKLIVIDNGDVVSHSGPGVDRLIQPGHNLGVAASWNLGMKMTPDARWWFVCGFDMSFGPGDLERLADYMDMASGPVLGFIEGFSAFALNRECLETVGYFDENFHPAYFEDNDYTRRVTLAGVPTLQVGPHGSKHVGSATIFSDPDYRDQNHRTFELNKAYYLLKWGGMPGQERYNLAFNHPVDYDLGIDAKRLREQAWRRS